MVKRFLIKSQAIIVLCLLLLGSNAQGQTAASYLFQADVTAGNFTPLIAPFNQITGSFDDELSTYIPFGGSPAFSFNFCGTSYNSFKVSPNGWLSLGNVSPSASVSRTNSLTNAGVLSPVIMALWDDLVSASGTARWTISGTSPNRVFTYERLNNFWSYDAYFYYYYYGYSSYGPSVSFQIKLFETTGRIELIYRQESGTVSFGSATIGIANSSADYQVLPSSGTNPVPSSSTFTTSISSKPATNQRYAFYPCISPTITTAAATVPTICAGQSTDLAVTNGAIGSATAWHWYTGSCGGTPVGTTVGAGTLSVSPTTTTTYYVRGQGGCVTPGACAQVTVTVNQPVAITTQPVAATDLCAGGTLNLSVAATNGASYQWYYTNGQINDGNVGGTITSGATTANLQITNIPSVLSGTYHVMVNGAAPCANVQSTNAVVTVNEPIVINSQPAASLSVCEGSAVNLNVDADNVGGILWHNGSGPLADGGSVTGSTTQDLVIDPSALSDAGNYYAVLTGLPGCANENTSNAAVSITPAVNITTNTPSTLGVCDGDDLNLSVTAANAVGYQWYGPSGALADGGNVSGATTSALTITNTTAANAGAYYVQITGTAPCAPVNSVTTTVTNDHPAAITTEPSDMTVCHTLGTSVSVVATGANLTYQWYEGSTLLSNTAPYSGTGTATLAISDVSGLNGNEYSVVVTGSCGSPAESDTAILTEDFNNTWDGSTDNNWSEATNWSCGIVPLVTTNAIITNVPNFAIVNIPGAVCNNLTINAGAMVSFNGTGNMLSIYGNTQNNGTFTGTNGTIVLAGSNPQSLAGTITFDDLEIDGGSTKTLTGDATVNGELILTDGFLALGNNNLTITDMSAQTTGSATSYVVTDGTGTIVGQNMNADSTIFHVGLPVSYNPVGIKNTGTPDTFMVRVMEHVFVDGDGTNPEQMNSPEVDRTWMISEQTPGGSFASVTPQWNAGEEINGFDPLHVYVAHYMGGTWTCEFDSSYYAGPRLGTDPYTTMEDSITSFSPFAVGSHGNFPLTIRMATISAVNVGARNKVEWKSVTEATGDVFELERSADGKMFTRIATVAANGKPSTYLQWDESPVQGVNYYRAKLMDANGRYSYSKVVSATVAGTNTFAIEAYPNPVHNTVSVKVNGMVSGKGSVVVTDVTGKVVGTVTTVENNSAELNVSHLANGMYLLKYTDDVRNESIKINKQ